MTTLTTFAVTVATTTRSGPLWRAVRRFLVARGVRRIPFHHYDALAPEGAVMLADGFPDDWVAHDVAHDLSLVDPITALAAKRAQPFFWSGVTAFARVAPEEASYLRQLEAAELGDGIAMQVYGPNLRSAYVGPGFGAGARPDIATAAVFEMKVAVQIAYLRYCELADDEAALARDLSPRERGILGWIARGKSNGVIASILGVSWHTVDTTVQRMFDKLQVSDRTTAAIRGLGVGLIDLAPDAGAGRVTRLRDMP